MTNRILLSLAISLAAPLVFAEDISGIWKHPEAPAWIEISLDEGTGTVVRNDKFPERVGREVLKDLRIDDSETNLWLGLLYVERSGEYEEAEISLPDPNRMEFKVKLGFISRTIDWVRVNEVPAAPAK